MQQVRQPEDRIHGRAELVGHVREESRLQLVGAPEVIRFLVELGVERHHAAIGVFELAVQVHELLLLPLQVVEGAQERLVLMLDLLDQADRARAPDGFRNLPGAIERDHRVTWRQELLQRDRGSLGGRLNAEVVHQPAGPDDAQAHSRVRLISAREHVVQLRDAGPLVADAHDQPLRLRLLV